MKDFVTHDIEIASFLYAKGEKLIKVSKDSVDFRKVNFTFENEEKCTELKFLFLNGGEINAKRLFECRKTLTGEIKHV